MACDSTLQGVSRECRDVIIAGGGLGGLFAAICLSRKGFNVTVAEKTKTFRAYGGPIQLASNGMSVVKATSKELYADVQKNSRPFWGTTSGIKDGYTGEWMFRFDAITEIPTEQNLPFAVCIDRSDLQSCLLDEIGRINKKNTEGRISVLMNSTINSYKQDISSNLVTARLSDDTHLSGDILIGADGIWSQVRSQMFQEPMGVRGRESTASHTGYKLFSGLPVVESDDYFDIGYCAYIGPDHYFVTCPDRRGRMQWYAFIKSRPYEQVIDGPSHLLVKIFQDWAPEINKLIVATSEDSIAQRDLWDRPPCLRRGWSDGNVALLGDSCHATMPNIGQGTGLAFEDAFVLSNILAKVQYRSQVSDALKEYYSMRLVRTAIIQGLGRMNSESIKILTPLLPIKPLIDSVISPLLPYVFRVQFGYCFSFSPVREGVSESIASAELMRDRHYTETIRAWKEDLH